MSAPHPFDPSGPPLVTLAQMSEKFPVSAPFPFKLDGEMQPVRFRLVKSAEKKRIRREAEVWVSQDYAEIEGIELPPGEVSNWIGTGGGIEAVTDEWYLRVVVASAVHEYAPEKYAPVFDGRQAGRDLLTDEEIEVLHAESLAHQVSYDPDRWTVEMFAEMIEDVKKKGSVSLIPFGTVNLSVFGASLVSRLSDSVITELLQPASDSPKPIEALTPAHLMQLLELQTERDEAVARVTELESQLGI